MAKILNKPELPYEPPEKCSITYVGFKHPHMQEAFLVARQQSLDRNMPAGAVLVKNGKTVGSGANGSTYHDEHGCKRARLGIPTGQGYELCEGCHPRNHAELRAIEDALANGHITNGAVLYLWGHWWCCEACWEAMTKAGVFQVCLLEGSEILFNREAPGNVVGDQGQIKHFNNLLCTA